MKKTLAFSTSLLYLVLAVIFSACTSDTKSIAGKIDSQEPLSQKEYGVMIDYLSGAFDDLSDLAKKGQLENDAERQKFEKKYEYADKFLMSLMYAKDLDADNKKKLDALERKFNDVVQSMASSLVPSGRQMQDPVKAEPVDSAAN